MNQAKELSKQDAKVLSKHESNDAKQCPWCQRYCLKDLNCNYIFACGLDDKGIFHVGQGCGRAWCYQCGLKFCGRMYTPDGRKLPCKTDHDAACCTKEEKYKQEEYCPGGHNSHCAKRF